MEDTHEILNAIRKIAGQTKLLELNAAIEAARAGDDITMQLHGNGFLYHMVRNFVGTIVEIGKAKKQVMISAKSSLVEIETLLEQRPRQTGHI